MTTAPKTTISFKVAEEDKEYFNKVLNRVADMYDVEDKGDALKLVFEKYLLEYEDKQPSKDYETERVKLSVNCGFLGFEQLNGFLCYELQYKKKKPNELGFNPDVVIMRCLQCKSGKEYVRRIGIEKQLTKEGIKKLLTLYKTLSQLVQRGLDIKGYCCISGLNEKGIIISSSDGLRLPCSYEDDPESLVSIELVCKERINDSTMKPPCRYLIDLLMRGRSLDIEDIAKKFDETLRQLPEPIEETLDSPPDQVDVDFKIVTDNNDEKGDEEK